MPPQQLAGGRPSVVTDGCVGVVLSSASLDSPSKRHAELAKKRPDDERPLAIRVPDRPFKTFYFERGVEAVPASSVEAVVGGRDDVAPVVGHSSVDRDLTAKTDLSPAISVRDALLGQEPRFGIAREKRR